ncbi:MAG: thiamine phosphate synthase [Alphaproteobacteria bacterium]|nr:thiamine phosphate synthase [Alphaproteobacteria bacterium]
MTLAERTRPPPPLLLLTDERGPDPLAMAARLPAGSGIVLRSYTLSTPERRELAIRLGILCKARRLWLVVAADPHLAALARADGLHLPEGIARHGILAPALLWLRRKGGFLTVAAHSQIAIRRAAILGARAALLSPVFTTASHPGARTIGPHRFAAWCRAAPIPVYALGGLSAKTVRRLRGAGAVGVATVGGVVTAHGSVRLRP